MKYVKHLDEEWYEQMLADYEQAFQQTFYKLAHFNSSVIPFEVEFSATPVKAKKKKEKDYPFPLAEKLHVVFNWLNGNGTKPKELNDILETILHLSWFNPFLDYTEVAEVEWERWTGPTGSHIGQFYRFSKVADAIDKGESINATDLSMMLGITSMAVGKQIKDGKVKAVKVKNEWTIEAPEAKSWLMKQMKIEQPNDDKIFYLQS